MSELDTQLEQVHREDTTKGENYYSRQFRSVYQTVRKSLVLIDKARKNEYEGGEKGKKGNLVKEAEITNQEAVEKAIEVLENALTQLE